MRINLLPRDPTAKLVTGDALEAVTRHLAGRSKLIDASEYSDRNFSVRAPSRDGLKAIAPKALGPAGHVVIRRLLGSYPSYLEFD